jgi:HNH endonuclease
MGEYQFLYRIGSFLGEDAEQAARLFDRPSWRYLYSLESVAAIEPFSLENVMALAGSRARVVWERYHGQTQHHRIIRTIEGEDEPLFRALITVNPNPVRSVTGQIAANAANAEIKAVRQRRTRDEIIRRLHALDRENRATAQGRQRRAAMRQRRSREFVSLLRVLYNDCCQVCGKRLASPDGGTATSHVHHLSPWDGDRSDRLDNVICVCPNDHALFTLGGLRWNDDGLEAWHDGSWVETELAIDFHLRHELS